MTTIKEAKSRGTRTQEPLRKIKKKKGKKKWKWSDQFAGSRSTNSPKSGGESLIVNEQGTGIGEVGGAKGHDLIEFGSITKLGTKSPNDLIPIPTSSTSSTNGNVNISPNFSISLSLPLSLPWLPHLPPTKSNDSVDSLSVSLSVSHEVLDRSEKASETSLLALLTRLEMRLALERRVGFIKGEVLGEGEREGRGEWSHSAVTEWLVRVEGV
jgi:hypothetical protein